MQSEIATTVQKAKVNDKYLLARGGGAYKCRFFHSPLPTAQLARNISSVPGNLGQASGCPGLTGRS